MSAALDGLSTGLTPLMKRANPSTDLRLLCHRPLLRKEDRYVS
jgi:hypothetical protein